VLSPKNGTFGARFVESGASVRVGVISDLLNGIRDVFCIICNTIMTADIVVEMSNRPLPVIWILHEWWDDEMIKENLRMRNYEGLSLKTVKQAMSLATRVVCVCQGQQALYNPNAPTTVIYVGVPDPSPRRALLNATVNELSLEKNKNLFTFLCLGIICPRKNQLWTIELFKKFAQNKNNVRLQIVGARYTRVYEMEYLEKVRAAAADDPRIEIIDVTEHVDRYYHSADCLILTSLNEVTPMVISEALSWGIPVLSTNIAGIKEMFNDGVEGFHFDPADELKALQSMEAIYSNDSLRKKMAQDARLRYETMFHMGKMVESYHQLVQAVAPPVILIDMDGTLVDWDQAFYAKWRKKGPIDRSTSFNMEDCVPEKLYSRAQALYCKKGFFEELNWMEGAEKAIKEMDAIGLKVMICTSPVKGSKYCVQEKINWVETHLGESWLDRLIICVDKVNFRPQC
jgi:glycosyltransferase involved in cell wall biosynthesis/5'(3')-deoxyribonucleotidase